jgi:hypothetical protein
VTLWPVGETVERIGDRDDEAAGFDRNRQGPRMAQEARGQPLGKDGLGRKTSGGRHGQVQQSGIG